MGIAKNEFGQSGYKTLKLTLSQKWADGINWLFLHTDTNSWKLKIYSMIFVCVYLEMAVAQ